MSNLQSSSSVPMVQITRTIDLLQCRPIAVMVREYGTEPCMVEIAKSVVKCIDQLGLTTTRTFIETFVEDVMEVYKYDSLEDVRECLKKGRRGEYPTKIYGRFNMLIFKEWMALHLEEKAAAREKAIENQKKEEDYSLMESLAGKVRTRADHDREKTMKVIMKADKKINWYLKNKLK